MEPSQRPLLFIAFVGARMRAHVSVVEMRRHTPPCGPVYSAGLTTCWTAGDANFALADVAVFRAAASAAWMLAAFILLAAFAVFIAFIGFAAFGAFILAAFAVFIAFIGFAAFGAFILAAFTAFMAFIAATIGGKAPGLKALRAAERAEGAAELLSSCA